MKCENVSIAIVMTCYNRREKTKSCIKALKKQSKEYGYNLFYYI